MQFRHSHDQITAIEGILDILLGGDPNKHAIAVLTGSAGTGKTTVVAEIIKEVQHNSMLNVELCASTHRAAAVLQGVVGRSVQTAHTAFKLRPSVTKYGKETLKSTGLSDIPYGSVIVIDESSMIGNAFLRAMVPTIIAKALKVLFVGDLYQLPPPVDICTIFDGTLPTFTLTTVHRQAGGNPILDKAIEYRDFIDGTRSDEPEIITALNSAGEGINVLAHSDFVTQFVKKYVNYETGAEVDVPMCTYTNESAINYNTMIRKASYFLEDTIAPFYLDERLISNNVVMQDETTIVVNNEVVHVKGYFDDELCGIPGYRVKVEGTYNKFVRSATKTVFVPKTKAAADKVLDVYKDEAIAARSAAKWRTFYALKNQLADLRPPFAGTTHKAQGGTFPAVFIDRTNINKCRQPALRARLMYVALTRASGNVYVNT